MANIVQYVNLQLVDNTNLKIGTGEDLELHHNATDSYIQNSTGNLNIINYADNKDIIFKCDDGSGGTTEYFRVDGGSEKTIFSKGLQLLDNIILAIGSSSDLQISHNTADTWFDNYTGNINIRNRQDDGDIIFWSDDGSGGHAEYFRLDGGDGRIKIPDQKILQLGAGGDLQFQHNSTDSLISNYTGHLYIQNHADDKQIIFQNDDGSGGVETYFYLDGLGGGSAPFTVFPDAAVLALGSNHDTYIQHTGAHMKIDNYTGNIEISNQADDGDLSLRCDNGSGGSKTYIKLDGGIATTLVYTDLLMVNDGNDGKIKLGASQDLEIYHDGSHSYIKDAGTGNLQILATDFQVNNSGNTKNMITATDGGAVTLFENGTGRLATTSTGVTVTGSMSVGAINTTGTLDISNSYPRINLNDTTNDDDWSIINDDGSFLIYNVTDGGQPIKVDGSNNTTLGAALNIPSTIYHVGDADTFFGFVSGNDTFGLTTGGGSRMDANNAGVRFGGSGTRITTILDEDAMGSNSATALATQQSIKAYVDNSTTGVLTYQGTWNASTNSPTLSSGSGTPGYYYIVSVAGSTNLDGITDWAVGDWAVFSDQATDAWQKIDNTAVGNVSGSGGANYVTKWTGSGTIANSSIIDQSGTVTFSGDVDIAGDVSLVDNKYLYIGTSNDLQLYHDGTHSYVSNTQNSGDLIIRNGANDKRIRFQCDDGSGGLATYFDMQGGAAGSYLFTQWYDNSVISLGNGYDLQMWHDGTNTKFYNQTGDLKVGVSGAFAIQNNSWDENIATFTKDGSVDLFYNSSKKFETTNTGIAVTGDATFTGEITLNGTDGHINLDGNNAVIFDNSNNNNPWYIRNGGSNAATLQMGIGTPGAGIKLTLDGSGNATFVGNIILDDGSGASPTITFKNGSDEEWYLSENSSGKLIFQQSTTERGEWSSGGLTIKNGALSITGDGSNAATLTESSAGILTIATVDDLILDAASDITLDAGGNDIRLFNSGVEYGKFKNDSSNLALYSSIQDKDIIFKGNDGGSTIDALTLDMSAAGAATFNAELYMPNYIYHTGDANTYFGFSGNDNFKVFTSGSTAIHAHDNGIVYLYHSGSTKLATSSTGVDITGGLTTSASSSIAGAQFTSNTSRNDNLKSIYGTDGDIEIYSDNTTAFMEITNVTNFVIGDSTQFNTANIAIARVGAQTGFKSMEEDWFGVYSDADTGKTHLTLSGTEKLRTDNSGVVVTGNVVLNGDSNIVLDTSVSSTQSSGTIIKIGSHMSALVAGNIYYAGNSMGNLYWYGADADTSSTENMLALSVGTDADVDGMLLNGIYHKASHGLTVGEPIYLSTTTSAMTNTAPSGSGDYVRVLGYAIDSNHIYFCPDNTWVKID